MAQCSVMLCDTGSSMVEAKTTPRLQPARHRMRRYAACFIRPTCLPDIDTVLGFPVLHMAHPGRDRFGPLHQAMQIRSQRPRSRTKTDLGERSTLPPQASPESVLLWRSYCLLLFQTVATPNHISGGHPPPPWDTHNDDTPKLTFVPRQAPKTLRSRNHYPIDLANPNLETQTRPPPHKHG